MPPGDPVVVCTAGTPAQAKVFAAMLQAEGIPAYTDGDSLADELATSRRLMNLLGTRVLVPACDLERAKDLLANTKVDEAELEAQALAAAPTELPAAARPVAALPVPDRPATGGRVAVAWAIVASILAFVFFGLWRAGRERRDQWDEWMQHKWESVGESEGFPLEEKMPDGVRWRRRNDHTIESETFDRDHDGKPEERRLYRADGSLHVVRRYDAEGREISDERFRDGLRILVRVDDGDVKEITLFDKDGKELKQQRWSGADGYVDVPRGR